MATAVDQHGSSDEEVWRDQDTTPPAIESAMRGLLAKRHVETGEVSPARVLNMVVVCDREYRGEVENRLRRVGRYAASRTILCAVERKRTKLDAWVSMAAVKQGELFISRERVEVDVGERHLPSLATIVAPLVVPDLATVVWAPHGHAAAEDALRELAQVVLVDSHDDELAAALDRTASLSKDFYVVDLSWLRSTPWRERVAAAFDHPAFRTELAQIDTVTVRHRTDSVASAALFTGWLASRLRWKTARLSRRDGELVGRCRARRGEVRVVLEPVDDAAAPGLVGVTITSARGTSVALDRSPGGLREVRTERGGGERSFTVMGASRGEGGILGEGVRQALLRDRTYKPALAAARELVA